MENLGKALREIRRRHDLTIEELARRTRISAKVLREMEAGNFQSIRGRFYIHHFVREYLRSMGEDPAPFLEQYPSLQQPPVASNSPAASTMHKLQVYRFRRRRGLGILLALLVMAVAAVLLFAPPPQEMLHWFIASPMPGIGGTVFEPGWLPASGLTSAPLGQPESLPCWIDRETRLWGPSTAPVTLNARFRDRCWARVVRGGRTELSRVFEAGEVLDARGYDMEVTLGNPSVVSLTINHRRDTRFTARNRPATIHPDPISPFRTEDHEPDPVP